MSTDIAPVSANMDWLLATRAAQSWAAVKMRKDTKAIESNVKLLGPPLPFFIQNHKQEQEFLASSSVLRQQIVMSAIGNKTDPSPPVEGQY